MNKAGTEILNANWATATIPPESGAMRDKLTNRTSSDREGQMRGSRTTDYQRHLSHSKNPNRIQSHQGYINQAQPTLIKNAK